MKSLNLMTISEFAEIIGVSINTLRNWDRNGKLKAITLPSGHRRYTNEMVQKVLKGDEIKEDDGKD